MSKRFPNIQGQPDVETPLLSSTPKGASTTEKGNNKSGRCRLLLGNALYFTSRTLVVAGAGFVVAGGGAKALTELNIEPADLGGENIYSATLGAAAAVIAWGAISAMDLLCEMPARLIPSCPSRLFCCKKSATTQRRVSFHSVSDQQGSPHATTDLQNESLMDAKEIIIVGGVGTALPSKSTSTSTTTTSAETLGFGT